MLPRQRRVTRRQFPLALKQSRAWHSPLLSLRVAPRPSKDGHQSTSFAFVVSHKVAAEAVDRNKLKRRARAIVRELLPRVKDNYVCLLFFKKEAATLSYQELRRVIREIITHNHVISL